jgi:RND family efflux transporter MFP subunit
MQTRTLAILVLAGGSLGAATLFQARAVCSTPLKPSGDLPVVEAAAAHGRVAAEGRVVAYPGAEVKVAAERAGRVVRMLVDEGRRVRAGELIAELESDELKAALDEAKARVTEADAEIRLAEINQHRRQELVAQKVVAQHDLDQATRDLEIARARHETAQAEVARLTAQIRKTRIVAPLAGTVVARSVDAGETLEAGDAVVTIADLTRLRVEGEADEADAATLALDAPVEITCDGYPGQRWRGRIEEIADSVTLRKLKPQDPARPTDTRVLAVKVAFAEPVPVRLGTTVELGIIGRSSGRP